MKWKWNFEDVGHAKYCETYLVAYPGGMGAARQRDCRGSLLATVPLLRWCVLSIESVRRISWWCYASRFLLFEDNYPHDDLLRIPTTVSAVSSSRLLPISWVRLSYWLLVLVLPALPLFRRWLRRIRRLRPWIPRSSTSICRCRPHRSKRGLLSQKQTIYFCKEGAVKTAPSFFSVKLRVVYWF